MSIHALMGEAPRHVTELFHPAFLNSMRTDPDFWFNRMVRDSETYDWSPRLPLQVIVGTADTNVDPESTRMLHDRAKARGGNVSMIELPGLDHAQTGAAAYALTLARFEALSQQP